MNVHVIFFLQIKSYSFLLAYIGFRKYDKNYILKKRMVLTFGPGYYGNEEFGIRIKNCYEVTSAKSENLLSKATNFIRFEPLTFVPFQKNLIIKELLGPEHVCYFYIFYIKKYKI